MNISIEQNNHIVLFNLAEGNVNELNASTTVAKFATVQQEGVRSVSREIEYYNLDVILSVGYRVNSKQASQFRQWANSILKDHLLKGYTINHNIIDNQAA